MSSRSPSDVGRRGRWRVGDVAAVPLGDGREGYAWVLNEPLVAFLEISSRSAAERPDISRIVGAPVAFRIWVMRRALTTRVWPIIGSAPPPAAVLEEPWFFKRDRIARTLSLYRKGVEVAADQKACQGLECAAVWDPEHVADRLRDHFDGRPNKWVESLRLRD